jgi:hypothetical protein
MKKKRISLIICAMALTGLNSCSLFDKLVPDVDTEYSKTFYVDVSDNSGSTDPLLVDVTNSSDYEDFKDHIDGFKINKITWEIKDYKAPSDLYFSGKLNAWQSDQKDAVVTGKISRLNLASVAGQGEQDTMEEISDGIDQVTKWLESPGNFNFDASYLLTDESNKPYEISESGYSFTLRITFYVTVITGAK